MPETIADDDVVSRIILDPKDFPGGVLDLRKSFMFSNDNQYRVSVNCHRLLGNVTATIHELGLKKEALDLAEGRQNRKYKGYCEAEVAPIRHINVNDLVHFEVYHKEENGNEAHCEIKMHFTQRNARGEAVNQLIDCFSGLIPYEEAA